MEGKDSGQRHKEQRPEKKRQTRERKTQDKGRQRAEIERAINTGQRRKTNRRQKKEDRQRDQTQKQTNGVHTQKTYTDTEKQTQKIKIIQRDRGTDIEAGGTASQPHALVCLEVN